MACQLCHNLVLMMDDQLLEEVDDQLLEEVDDQLLGEMDDQLLEEMLKVRELPINEKGELSDKTR